MQELRFYSFTNFYLSSIQQGIQPGHAAVDLLTKYSLLSSGAAKMVGDWAREHKTFVCLNGGNNASLQELWSFLDDINNPYPYVAFHEDEQSLGGVMTTIGIILPEKIFATASAERASFRSSVFTRIDDRFVEDYHTWLATFVDADVGREYLFTDWEKELVERLNTYGLAK